MAKRGPGKFSSDLDAAIYSLSLDGGPDEEMGEADTTGWYGLMRDGSEIAATLKSYRDGEPGGLLELVEGDVSDSDLEYLRTDGRAGVILHVDSAGFVGVTYYAKGSDLDRDWKEVEEFVGGDELEENRPRRRNGEEDILRDETIEPYLEGKGPVFQIQTWETGKIDRSHHRNSPFLGYRITMTEPGKKPEVVFEGEDYSPSPMIGADDDRTLDDIVAFFTSDSDDDTRTERQRAIVRKHGDTLSGEATVRWGEDAEREENSRRRKNPQTRWNVYLQGELTDGVYYDESMTADEVRRSLIDQDGYDPRITVKKRDRRHTHAPDAPEPEDNRYAPNGGFGDIAALKAANAAAGMHFFDRGNMRFARSKLESKLYGGRYFVTSEQMGDDSPRLYTVREAMPDASIKTIGQYQGYRHVEDARDAARDLLKSRSPNVRRQAAER